MKSIKKKIARTQNDLNKMREHETNCCCTPQYGTGFIYSHINTLNYKNALQEKQKRTKFESNCIHTCPAITTRGDHTGNGILIDFVGLPDAPRKMCIKWVLQNVSRKDFTRF